MLITLWFSSHSISPNWNPLISPDFSLKLSPLAFHSILFWTRQSLYLKRFEFCFLIIRAVVFFNLRFYTIVKYCNHQVLVIGQKYLIYNQSSWISELTHVITSLNYYFIFGSHGYRHWLIGKIGSRAGAINPCFVVSIRKWDYQLWKRN